MTEPEQRPPRPVYSHLAALTTGVGLYEHALLRAPRVEHGYCTDDVARALAVVVREPVQTKELRRLREVYLRFLERAVTRDGAVHNRMDAVGQWVDDPQTDDCWGRAVAGLGVAVRRASERVVRGRAFFAFLGAAQARSDDVRANAFASIGAADVLAVRPDCRPARELLVDCLARLPRGVAEGWSWPEGQLRYANGSLCQALVAGGHALGDDAIRDHGVAQLGVLLGIETGPEGHLSLVGTSGRRPTDPGPLWDQQPIEAAAISSACLEALRVTHAATWAVEVGRAWAWFTGFNDSATAMYDPADGAGFDGLEPDGRNDNCGAESTLAALSTLQDLHSIRGA
ncbi:MAG TPA: hypothetical protein VLS51_06405, partial [Propionibacteriaceae bacterium]|nr:hypothetical protein [Propionibacteriaceae bacterium]